MGEKTELRLVHDDMERYLENDCYCPYEIYDVSGFFFDLFKPDTECVVTTQTSTATVVVACGVHSEDSPQALIFWHDDGSGRIVDARRVDATENNLDILSDIALGVDVGGRKVDEYVKGKTASSVAKVLGMCDAVFVS